MNILVVEDEPLIANVLKKGLSEQGYSVDLATDGMAGKEFASRKKYDLMILDLVLPKKNGLDLCREIREAGEITPILMLTALGGTGNIVAGLDCGADDYLVKPFDFEELLARIRALLRRQEIQQGDTLLTIADLELDTWNKKVRRGAVEVRLSSREFTLLEMFLRNQGRILDRAEIAEKVWDINFDTGTNVIDVYVNYLRNKIDKQNVRKLIHTVVGMGYVMEERD